MIHKPFHQLEHLLGSCDTYSAAYSLLLQYSTVPPSLPDDIHRMEMNERENNNEEEEEEVIIILLMLL